MQLECQVCGTAPANVECPGCHAMFYCSEKHLRHHMNLGHGEECARMSGQMCRAQELQAFPFAWARQLAVAVPGGGDTAVCSFLKSLDIHGLPLWSRECCCEDFTPFGTLGPMATSSCWGDHLSFLANKLDLSQGGASSIISDWREYYTARGFPDDHPAALILSTAMTLHHAVVWSWQQQHNSSDPPRSLNLHILGAAKEVDQTSLFLELANLLPECQISVQLIGPSVPAGLPTQRLAAISAGSLEVDVSYHHGLYHEVLPNLHSCIDLIFAPNAGASTYSPSNSVGKS